MTHIPPADEALWLALRLLGKQRQLHPSGFGSHSIGFSVEGAIYEVLALRESDLDLCEDDGSWDHQQRWQVSTECMVAVAAQLGELRPSRAYLTVCTFSESAPPMRDVLRILDAAGRAVLLAAPVPIAA